MQDSSLRTLAIVILVPFSALTAVAIVADGTNGFPNAIIYNFLSLQIWLDLVIAMLFWCAWVIVDCRQNTRSPVAWIIAALLFGAFAPLIYMVIYRRWPASTGTTDLTDSGTGPRSFGAVAFALLFVVTIAGLAIDGSDIAGTVTQSWSNIQIWVDLVIVILLWVPWMFSDAKSHGINPWGWFIFAAVLGAFSPLLSLLVYNRWPASHPVSAQPTS